MEVVRADELVFVPLACGSRLASLGLASFRLRGGLRMDLGLAGKVAIVTGGSKGIGKAIAQELAGEGVDVAICARDRRVLEEAAKTLATATRRRIVPIVCDTTSTK